MTNLNKKFIPIAIVIAGVLIAGAFIYTKQVGTSISIQEAGEKSIAFINQTLQNEGVTASLIGVVDEGEVFRIHLKIAETEYDSYITKDGKLLFPNAFNLAEFSSEEPEQEPLAEPVSAEAFAQCLTDKGAKFYGAHWCSYCDKEKELFGEAAQYLPYIECSDEDRNMLPVCQKAGISTFPTWEFNGELSPGYKTFEQLAELSGCSLGR